MTLSLQPLHAEVAKLVRSPCYTNVVTETELRTKIRTKGVRGHRREGFEGLAGLMSLVEVIHLLC